MMSRIRVLIVDDNVQVRQDLSTLLTLAGIAGGFILEAVGEASNGQEAIEQVINLHPDIVLMDLAMPVLDGWESTRQIKSMFPNIKVIALTVHSDQESREKAFNSGVNGFIEKGAPAADIIRKIREEPF